MELKTKLMILGIIFFLVTIVFCVALVWMTKIVEKKALARKAAEREFRETKGLPRDQEKS